jgi:tRNA nucleotidyltransferase (CCA-adding enzyme)
LPRLDDLEPTAREVVRVACEAAGRRALRLAWVGGGVRDLLLGRAHPDLDLVAEGPIEELATELASALGATARHHPRFATATLELPDGARLDLATARAESYATPGALPTVTPGGLEEDLARRDFTVNAMALELVPEGRRGRLLDPHGGRSDLEARLLRTLHPRSFADDPTRILRGVRFALRLGFAFEPHTEDTARRAVAAGAFDPLSGPRLAEALRKLAREAVPLPALAGRIADLGIPGALEPALAGWSGASLAPAAAGLDPWARLLLAWGAALDGAGRKRLAARLELPGAERDLVILEAERARDAGRVLQRSVVRPHTAVELLRGLSPEGCALAAQAGERAAAWVERFRAELADVALSVGARELIAAGAAPGPGLGAALAATLRARLDGEIGPGEELDHALARYREEEIRCGRS